MKYNLACMYVVFHTKLMTQKMENVIKHKARNKAPNVCSFDVKKTTSYRQHLNLIQLKSNKNH